MVGGFSTGVDNNMEHKTESQFSHHDTCPSCNSRDNLAVYDDGHAYCFGCKYYKNKEGATKVTEANTIAVKNLARGTASALPARHISLETTTKFNYHKGTFNGKPVHIANYIKKGTVVGQKLRFANKDFVWLGDKTDVGLYGEWLWRDKGKLITVVEGELDALSLSQVQNNKYPVVSLRTGAAGATKDIKNSLEWLEGFETVVFMFDEDEPGRKAAQACAQLLTPGKAKIASLPLKDANEMLKAGRVKELLDAMWGAKEYRPDGILNGSELWEEISSKEELYSVDYPYEGLTEKTHGLRKNEMVCVTAGSGIGKSAFVREIGYDLIKKGEKVGFIMLEESTKRTALGIMGLELNKPVHLGMTDISKGDMEIAFKATIGNGNAYLYDHFGSSSITNILSRIRYLAKGCGCNYIILDHLSIIVSGLADGDERRLIDNLLTQLRVLVSETGVGLIIISHLRRPEGKGHEEGAQTSLSQLRGSHSIAQLSDIVIGLERSSADGSNDTVVRVLKNRFSGETGKACTVRYYPKTGRLHESVEDFMEEE